MSLRMLHPSLRLDLSSTNCLAAILKTRFIACTVAVASKCGELSAFVFCAFVHMDIAQVHVMCCLLMASFRPRTMEI